MTAVHPPHMIAEDSLGSEEGRAARAAGVTASEVHEIAVGGRRTHRRILTRKQNGATFQGNKHTRRGHEREPFLLAWACAHVATLAVNIALYGNPDNPLIMATPDGLGADAAGEFGVEVKSHTADWDRDDIPAEHMAQMQLGMYVLGYGRWLYVWEVMGEDGTPTLDAPRFRWVARDEKHIARLVKEAEAFIAWRAAGAPADDLPPEVDDALAIIAEARTMMAPHKKAEAEALAVIRKYAEESADEHGAKGAGLRAGFTYAKKTETVLDEDAWAAAEPHTRAAFLATQERVAEYERNALALYGREKQSSRLSVTEMKDAA